MPKQQASTPHPNSKKHTGETIEAATYLFVSKSRHQPLSSLPSPRPIPRILPRPSGTSGEGLRWAPYRSEEGRTAVGRCSGSSGSSPGEFQEEGGVVLLEGGGGRGRVKEAPRRGGSGNSGGGGDCRGDELECGGASCVLNRAHVGGCRCGHDKGAIVLSHASSDVKMAFKSRGPGTSSTKGLSSCGVEREHEGKAL